MKPIPSLPLDVSQNFRGALWMIVGTIFFALNDGLIKWLGRTIHPVEMVWFRYAVGLCLLSPVFMRMGWSGLKTERLPLHVVRLVLAVVGNVGMYYSVVYLYLADATAISFARPLFTALLGGMVLGEAIGWRRAVATVVGFAGVLVIIRPSYGEVDIAMLIAVVSALLVAWAQILIRRLSSTEPPNRTLFYFHAGGLVLFLPPTMLFWTMPSATELPLLICSGALMTAALFCFVRGLSFGEASFVAPMEYTRIVYAAILGFVLFSELPELWTWIGTAIIVASALFLASERPMQRAA